MENVKRNQETIKTMYPKTHERYKNSNSPYACEVDEEHKRGEDTVTFFQNVSYEQHFKVC